MPGVLKDEQQVEKSDVAETEQARTGLPRRKETHTHRNSWPLLA